MWKECIAVIILAVILVSFALGGAYFVDSHITGNPYALTAVVVEVDQENNTVTCEDSHRNLWEFYGVEAWEIGDCASLLMDDQGTASLYDDKVKDARRSAWTLVY